MDWTKQGTEAFNYLKGIGNKVKQIALQLTEVEIKVEDATNNDPWGPHGKDMAEITRAAYELESYKQIMGVIARRLQDQGEDWRHVYKSLLLLEYMSKHGPQKVVEELVSNVGVIEKLTYFEYKDANAKDWGLNVRQRAKELVALINDPERMRAERHKAKANETKYTGVSSDDIRSGGFALKSSSGAGSSFGSSGGASKYRSGGGLGGPRSSSAGGFASSSGRSLYDDYDEPTVVDKDPKEATRERIERLKKDAGVDGDDPGHDKGSLPPALKPALKPGRAATAEAAADAAAARGPKKLSDVRVNPSIAASLGQLAPPPAAAPMAAKSGSSSNGSLAPAALAGPSGTDLLLELDAPGSASQWSAFEGNGSAAQDLLTSAPAAPAAARPAVDPFDAFSASPVAAPPPAARSQAPADPFAPAKPSAAPTPGMPLPSSALSEDLFSAAPSPLDGLMQAQPGAGQQQQQYDAFGAFAQAPRQQQAGWQPQTQQQPLGHGQAYPVQKQPPYGGGFLQGAGPQASFGVLSSALQQNGPVAGHGRGAGPGAAAPAPVAAPVAAANAPLNPAAVPIVSSRSKDPFADLAAF